MVVIHVIQVQLTTSHTLPAPYYICTCQLYVIAGGVDSCDPGSVSRQVQGATHQLDKVKDRLKALKSLLDYQVT